MASCLMNKAAAKFTWKLSATLRAALDLVGEDLSAHYADIFSPTTNTERLGLKVKRSPAYIVSMASLAMDEAAATCSES